VIRVVSTATSAVRTDDFPVVGDLKLLAEVQLFQCHFDFKLDARPSLLTRPAAAKEASEYIEWASLLFRLIDTLFSTSVILAPQLRV